MDPETQTTQAPGFDSAAEEAQHNKAAQEGEAQGDESAEKSDESSKDAASEGEKQDEE